MGGNPVETKVEVPNVTDVLAAAAGVPTPPPKKAGLWAKAWHYRKLAMIIGGSGITLGGAGYGYKYFTATPGKANAEVAAVASKPEEPKGLPPTVKDDPWALPPVTPVKGEMPVPPAKATDIVIPEVATPPTKSTKPDPDLPTLVLPPNPGVDTKKTVKTDEPTLVLPPNPGVDTKKTVKTDEPTLVLPPMPGADTKKTTEPPALVTLPDIAPPSTDKKKNDGDTFKATDPLTTDKTKPLPTGPAPLPSDVTERKEKPSTIIRSAGTDPMPPAAPPIPDVPTIAPPDAESTKKDKPKVSSIEIDVPSINSPDTKKDTTPPLPPLTPPEIRKDTVPPVPPITVPGPSKNDPPVVVPGKTPEIPTVRMPDLTLPPIPNTDPPKPPMGSDPIPMITPPDLTIPSVGTAPAVKKDNYDEDWHTWKQGDSFTLISQEFLHDAKYAAALEAYNKDRGKGSDRIIRVPPIYVLEEQFPHLINKPEKTDKPEPTSPPESKTNNGLRFEPAAPIPSAGRSAPAPATPTAAPPRDQYRVMAEGGETIREVARKALGDSNLWWKLGELNPSIDPARPIPVGTALKLPK
ncbi:MAG TPA: hypothetical protein VHR66_09580 [Gemmataceae bacterium]|jgi:hypothetical protein|nr:hypothetical protein [Gemmataceae bacterium]